MANITDDFTKLWGMIEAGTDEKYYENIMQNISALGSSMQVTTDYRMKTLELMKEFIEVENNLYTDFNNAMKTLGDEATAMSEKKMSILDENFETEFTAYTEKVYDRFVIVIGTAMVNERIVWRQIPDMFSLIGDSPLNMERVINAAKETHLAVEYCEERVRKVIASLGGDEDVAKFNTDLLTFIMVASKKDE